MKFDLKPGSNRLGIYVYDFGNKYIDFQYLTVISGGLSIEPASLNGEVNKEYTFTAKTDSPPDKVRYDWYVADKQVQSGSSNTLTTKFAAEGAYTILAKLFEKDGKEITSGQATANIKKTVPASPTSSPTPSMPW